VTAETTAGRGAGAAGLRLRNGAHGYGVVTKVLHWLVHVAAQSTLLGAVALHVGRVLRHTVVRRNRHLARML
jgi:cytochrome b561